MVLRSTAATGVLEDLQKLLKQELLKEWIAQGHYMSGKIIEEAEFVTETVANTLRMDLYMYGYGAIIETGTPASKIPYSGRSGSGGTSKYIQALIGYVEKRMNISDLKKAKSIAFAIAETQKKEGMPTRGSFSYTTTGKRTGWIQEVFDRNEGLIAEFMFRYVNVIFETQFTNMVTKYQRKFKE